MSRGERGECVFVWYGVRGGLVCGGMEWGGGWLCSPRAHVPPGGNTEGAHQP